jgi:hypothetical protein
LSIYNHPHFHWGIVEEGPMKITKGQLTLAGWLSITNAIFAIPSIAMSWFLETKSGAGAKLSQAILTLVSLGLFLYVIISLRKLLNYRFQFHQADIYISLLIWGNVILTALSLLVLGNQEFERFMNVLSIVSLIILGILAIMFATRLQRFPGDLYGLLKPFCYTTIASGICFITVLLAPVGVIVGAVSDVILGIIFFRAAEQPPSPMEIFGTPIE